jgi:predicted dinucleotide-binding enzyme
VFSYARSAQQLEKLAREARGRARAGSPREAVHEADVVLLAVHWSRVNDVLDQAGDLSGTVVIVAALIRDIGFEPLDSGPLRVARFMEPFGLLMAQLAYETDAGPEVAYRFERFE